MSMKIQISEASGTGWSARQNISSGTRWEDIVGYSRAVRVGPMVFVTGTVAYDETKGQIACPGDAYGQMVNAIGRVERALHKAGARLGDVVRTRIFVADIGRWEEIGRAHHEFFGKVKPATTMVEVARLIDSAALIEIEADAIIGVGRTTTAD